jgi:DNA-binding PadR family transcriptional regulator
MAAVGARGGFGPGPRMFGRGDLKYAMLELLRERPQHGYEMIKQLEARAGGFYTPSAGAVYPTLQLLEDRGWVTSETQEGKKVYTITDEGRQALLDRHEREPEFGPRGGPWGGPHGKHWHGPHGHHGPFSREAGPELHALRHESGEVMRLMRAAVMVSGGDPERLARLRAIVERAKGDLNEFLGQGQRSETGAASGAERETPSAPASGPVENL